jgi:hypothetical protein
MKARSATTGIVNIELPVDLAMCLRFLAEEGEEDISDTLARLLLKWLPPRPEPEPGKRIRKPDPRSYRPGEPENWGRWRVIATVCMKEFRARKLAGGRAPGHRLRAALRTYIHMRVIDASGGGNGTPAR